MSHIHTRSLETLYTFHFHPGDPQLHNTPSGILELPRCSAFAEVLHSQLSLDDFHHISLNSYAEVKCDRVLLNFVLAG